MMISLRRTIVIDPFPKGPTFELLMFTTTHGPKDGRPSIGYRLDQIDEGHGNILLFIGEDWHPTTLEEPFGDGSAMDLIHELVAREYEGTCAHVRYWVDHYSEEMRDRADEMLEVEPMVSSLYPSGYDA